MLEIRYELVMVNSSNLAFSNSLLRFMNKIPLSSLTITLRTKCTTTPQLSFLSTSAEKQSHHKLPYLPTSYIRYTSYTPVTLIIKMCIVVGHHTGQWSYRPGGLYMIHGNGWDLSQPTFTENKFSIRTVKYRFLKQSGH